MSNNGVDLKIFDIIISTQIKGQILLIEIENM